MLPQRRPRGRRAASSLLLLLLAQIFHPARGERQLAKIKSNSKGQRRAPFAFFVTRLLLFRITLSPTEKILEKRNSQDDGFCEASAGDREAARVLESVVAEVLLRAPSLRRRRGPAADGSGHSRLVFVFVFLRRRFLDDAHHHAVHPSPGLRDQVREELSTIRWSGRQADRDGCGCGR